MSETIQFHIDGRFQADIRRENASWTVQPTDKHARANLNAPVPSTGLEDDDIAFYLDALFLEAIDNDV